MRFVRLLLDFIILNLQVYFKFLIYFNKVQKIVMRIIKILQMRKCLIPIFKVISHNLFTH